MTLIDFGYQCLDKAEKCREAALDSDGIAAQCDAFHIPVADAMARAARVRVSELLNLEHQYLKTAADYLVEN